MKLGYRPALDGVRGIAIMSVVGLHTFRIPRQGALGVDLFFVLSGFLITTLLLEEHRERGRISLVAFYRRRALRLLPALFALLLTYAVVQAVILVARGDFHGATLREPLLGVAAAAGYFSNLFQLAHDVPLSLSHLWSLAEEEQFYIVWPALLLLVLRYRPASSSRIVLGLIAAVAVERLALTLSGTGYLRLYLGPDTHAEPLLIGCLFGIWFVRGQLPRIAATKAARQWTSTVALTLVALGLFELYRLFPTGIYGTPVLTVFACAAALLIVCAAMGDSAVARLLSTRPLTFLGRISYSLYLWQLPVIGALGLRLGAGGARAALAAAGAILMAIASYYVVELPFLRRKRRVRRQESSAPALAPAATQPATT
jgi:peptidoglycan/LPS O-acetylase OafA/YrhL